MCPSAADGGARVLIVPIEEAQPGMKLAMHVSHPEQPDHDLLKAGYLLDLKVIGRLRALAIPCVYVDYPGLEDLDRHLAPYLSPARQELYTQIKETITSVEKKTRPSVGFADYYATTRQLIITLLQG